MKRIIRVFPRRTRATPIDDLAFCGMPDFWVHGDEVHISVSFTWDIPKAEMLAKEWERIAPVQIGGAATGKQSGNFEPGKYLKPGYVITSRGCRNRCWFCSVWKREGDIREISITEGFNVLDDNLLQCSDQHIKDVIKMLSKQKEKAEFTGGLEAALLKPWHVKLFRELKPKQMFFAYDTPSDREPLFEAGKMLLDGGFQTKNHVLRSYVLIGYPKDTFRLAEKRLTDAIKAGFMPMAMLYRNDNNETDIIWRKYQREWAIPAIVASKMRLILKGEDK